MRMDSNKDVIRFLNANLPQSDSILLGCRADDNVKGHECCEYNLIAINDSQSSPHKLRYFSQTSSSNKNSKKIFLVRFLSTEELYKNSLIGYSDFGYYPGQLFQNKESNPFQQKNRTYRRAFKSRLKSEILNNIYDLSLLSNTLSRNRANESTISFELKLVSLRTLRNYIHMYLSKEHRPSHLKYQINSVIQNESMTVREGIDSILEIIGTHRFNISVLNRSENSLKFLLGNIPSPTKRLILDKLQFLRERSMYVDGMLLIYNYILDNYMGPEQKLSYPQLLRRTTDIDKKEKTTLIKEINFLINSNKELI